MAFGPRTWRHLDEEARAQFWATLALRHTRGLGPRSWTRLLRHFGSAYAAIRQIPQWGEARVSSDKAAQVAAGSWRVTAMEEWNAARTLDAHIVLWHDAHYPELLRQLPDAPALLYCRGDMSLLKAPALAVVGARNCTEEGMRMAATIARQLADCGVTIISGMAHGIDRAAHIAAMRGVGKSVAVLGTGMDIVYPPSNKDIFENLSDSGLVATEFAPGTKPLTTNFPIRNRVISGLALGVLVVEAALRSGSLITARLALEQNREVYAVPGSPSASASKGCQELVRQGARPVFSAEHVLQDMAPMLSAHGMEEARLLNAVRAVAQSQAAEKEEPPFNGQCPAKKPKSASSSLGGKPAGAKESVPPPLESLDADAARLVCALRGGDTLHVDALCETVGLPAFRVSSLLTFLEVEGYVRRMPGARYALVAE